jgi:hypothetical protein
MAARVSVVWCSSAGSSAGPLSRDQVPDAESKDRAYLKPSAQVWRLKYVSIGYPRVRRAGKSWTLTFLAAILLCSVGPVGFVVMLLLQDAADRETLAACKVDLMTAHYSKGFAFALPVGVLAVALLGLVLLFALFVFGRGQKRGWTKAVGACMALVSVLSALPVGMITSEYHDYPGSDITSAMGHPCGFG